MFTIAMIGHRGLPARSGGVEKHVEQLSMGLVERGHRVISFGREWYVGSAKPPTGIEQINTPGIRTKYLDAATHTITALWAARKVRPDIVHMHGVGIALFIPLARVLLPKAKIVATFHCIDRYREKWGWFAKLALHVGEWMACHLAHRTITVSEELTEYCSQNYGVRPWYITHAFPALLPPTNSEEWLKKHELEKNNYFLFVGRLMADKGPHLLIEAYAKAKEQAPELFAKMPLVIVGSSAFTDHYAQNVFQRAAQVPGVMAIGERCGDELVALQANAKAHVFPSTSEGLAFTLLEACQLGRAVIASDLEANRSATGGWMIPLQDFDIEHIKDVLIRVAQRNSDELQELGARAQLHALKAFDVDDRCRDLIQLYSDVMGRPRELVTMLTLEALQENR